MDYGYTFFLTALEVAADRDLTDLQNGAWAVRFGQRADQRAWAGFMRLGRKTWSRPVDPKKLAALVGAKITKQVAQKKAKPDGGT